MADDLLEIVERSVRINKSPDQIKEDLIAKGFMEEEVDQAIQNVTQKHSKQKKSESRRLARIFSTKEVFDRVGYGFVPNQFINILFYLTGANYFWLGAINGLKAIISIVVSSVMQEYQKVRQIGKGVISKAGYVFGFSFIGMAAAALIDSWPLFALFLLIGGVGVVTHGDLYNNLVRRHLKKEKMTKFLARVGQLGLLITAVCMLVSGWLLEKFPETGAHTVTIAGNTYPLLGYLISFEITAIAFILSGYMLSHIKEKKQAAEEKAKGFLKKYMSDMKVYRQTFMHNKTLFLMILTGILLGVVQVLGNSYFGLFIYQEFREMWLGGFMNVAVIYFVAVMTSFIGPWFSQWFNRHTGLVPTLVFGTLLVALMPLALAYNPNLVAIGIANALSVIGAAILGVSQGMLARKLLHEDERKVYFSVASMAGVIPFIILIPAGAWLAQAYGLQLLFKILAAILIFVVSPLYIVLVGMGNKKRL